MITFTDLSKISGLAIKSSALIEVVSILSSSFEVLDWMFVYFRDERSEPHYLSAEESRNFVRSNEFFDPDLGELVDNPGSKLMPYFKADRNMLCSVVE